VRAIAEAKIRREFEGSGDGDVEEKEKKLRASKVRRF